MSTLPRRKGITLVGLIVALLIGTLFAAILLPLVQRSRESARRTSCVNNLKQIGIALQHYHDVHKRLPATSNQNDPAGVASVWWPEPGSASTGGAIPSVGYTSAAGSTEATAGFSWLVLLLPYLDQEKLYDAISQASGEFSADAFTPFNVAGTKDGTSTGQTFSVPVEGALSGRQHFATVEIEGFFCPSFTGSHTVARSTYEGRLPVDPPATYGGLEGSAALGSSPARAAITNYVALAATHFTCMQYAKEERLAAATAIPSDIEPPNGVIVPGIGLNIRAVTDGTSQTLVVCETLEPAMNSWYDGTTAWTTAINPNTVADFPPDWRVNAANNPMGYWLAPSGSTTALNVGPAPDATVAYCPAIESYSAAPRLISWGPSSNHAGGVVTHLALDASVHNVTTDIDPTIYMHIITRSGREPSASGCEDRD